MLEKEKEFENLIKEKDHQNDVLIKERDSLVDENCQLKEQLRKLSTSPASIKQEEIKSVVAKEENY